MRKILLAAFLSLMVPAMVHAGSSGAEFLNLGAGARPLALGGAYTASPADVDAMYYNPAGIASMSRSELSVTHSEWIENTDYDIVSFGQPTSVGTFGASAFRVGGSAFEGRDALRQQTGDFTAQDLAMMLSYAKSAGPFGAGVNVKYLTSRIGSDSASTYALDAGLMAQLPAAHMAFGAAALNMGSGLRFVDQVDRLPLTLAFGSSWQPVRPLRFALDVKHQPYDQITELDTGAEYGVSVFVFRIGYTAPIQGDADKTLSAGEHIRGGIGFHVSRFRIDYTLAPFGDLGLTHRFTLAMFFGPSDCSDEDKNIQEPKSAAAAPDPLIAQISQ